MSKLKVVDVFAGCGGLSLGFKNAGYDICSHIEIDKKCCETIQEATIINPEDDIQYKLEFPE